MSAALSRQSHLHRLREKVRAIETFAGEEERKTLPFGIAAMDRKLAGGGLLWGGLHEMTGATASLSDDAAATLFTAGIAARAAAEGGGTVLWAVRWRDLFAPGLAQAGLGPAHLMQAECRRDEDVLAVMEEGLKHGSLAAVVGEVGPTAMAATRRLQLAAEEHGTMALMLRRWPRNGVDPLAAPSAAVSRWQIACAPSEDLPVQGLGRSRWRVDLVRQRGGEPFHRIVEACDAEGRLAEPRRPGRSLDEPDRKAVREAA